MASLARGETVTKQRIPALEFLDMVGQEPGDAVRRALGPTRPHIVDLVAQDAFERRWQLAGEVLEELREIRLQPGNRMIATADEEQQDMGLRSNAARGKNSQGFAEAGRALACQHTAQRILMYLRVARDVAARPATGLDCGKQQPGEIGANLLFGKERHVGHL